MQDGQQKIAYLSYYGIRISQKKKIVFKNKWYRYITLVGLSIFENQKYIQ